MIRHLLKLLWNRKRASALIVVEIVMAFLVLTAVIGAFAHFAINWQRPLGFDAARVWTLNVTFAPGERDRETTAKNERFASLLREVKRVRGVESAAGVLLPPYVAGNWTSEFGARGSSYYNINSVTDEFAGTMGLEIVDGRWFGPEDDGVAWKPVVLNQEAVGRYFAGKSPVGQILNPEPEHDEPLRRVVGVVKEFRKGGELQAPEPYAFVRTQLSDPATIVPDNIVVRVAPGSGTELEVELLERARSIAPDWSFEVRPISVSRRGALRLQFAPIIAGGVVAVSLILLVAMGLTGVMWQNVTRRTREIGLRRALGASASDVQWQILVESLIIAAIGLTGGLLVAIQAPLAGMLADIRTSVIAAGLAGAAVTILFIVTLCAWYPSRLASGVEPAEALHYE
jgi:putative ABC transport system permease protein